MIFEVFSVCIFVSAAKVRALKVIAAEPEAAAVLFKISAFIVRTFPVPEISPEKSISFAEISLPVTPIVSGAFILRVFNLPPVAFPTLSLMVTADAVRVSSCVSEVLPLIVPYSCTPVLPVLIVVSPVATRFFAENPAALMFPFTEVFPVVEVCSKVLPNVTGIILSEPSFFEPSKVTIPFVFNVTAFEIFAPLLKIMLPPVVSSERFVIVGVPLKVVEVAFVIAQFVIAVSPLIIVVPFVIFRLVML